MDINLKYLSLFEEKEKRKKILADFCDKHEINDRDSFLELSTFATHAFENFLIKYYICSTLIILFLFYIPTAFNLLNLGSNLKSNTGNIAFLDPLFNALDMYGVFGVFISSHNFSFIILSFLIFTNIFFSGVIYHILFSNNYFNIQRNAIAKLLKKDPLLKYEYVKSTTEIKRKKVRFIEYKKDIDRFEKEIESLYNKVDWRTITTTYVKMSLENKLPYSEKLLLVSLKNYMNNNDYIYLQKTYLKRENHNIIERL